MTENRYVAVAYNYRDEDGLWEGVLDRVTGRISTALDREDIETLNTDPDRVQHVLWTWGPGDAVTVVGELGDVPERIMLPFGVVRHDVSVDDNEVALTITRNPDGGAGVTLSDTDSVYARVRPSQAASVASAILRAAGVDPTNVDWDEAAKGGE